MPTWERTDRFRRDFEALSTADQERFKACVADKFIPAISNGPPYPNGLRIKGVQGSKGVYEMTWAPDGRATYQFGEELEPGDPHVVWRRVGTHDVFAAP